LREQKTNLSKKIQDAKDQLATAKTKASQITKEEASFVQSLPHFYVFARSKFDAVYQLAHSSTILIGSAGDSNYSQIGTADSYFPFNSADMTYWNSVVTRFDNIANDTTKTDAEKDQARLAIQQEISTKYTDAVIISAFKTIAANFTKLNDILNITKNNLMSFNNIINAIRQIKVLVKRVFTAPGVVDMIKVLIPGVTVDDVLRMIAFFVLPNAASYVATDDDGKDVTYNLADVRTNNSSVDASTITFITSKITELAQSS